MHALRGYGALFCTAISGGNVVRGHAVAEHMSGTRVRVRRQVRAGVREGGEHCLRLMGMVGGGSSSGLFMWSGLEGKSGAAGGCGVMSVLRSAAMRMSTNSVHRISDFVRIVYERHLTCGPLI
jgi:hypothetical protein